MLNGNMTNHNVTFDFLIFFKQINKKQMKKKKKKERNNNNPHLSFAVVTFQM